MCWRVILLVIVCMSEIPSAANAQKERQRIMEGARIRVSASLVQGEFIVVESIHDTLVLRDSENMGKTIILPLNSMTSLDVRHARSPGYGALRGAGIGLFAGAVGGAVIGFASGDDPPGLISLKAKDKAVIGGIALGFTGAIVGGLVGLIHPGGWWERVDLEQDVGLSCDGDGGFRLYCSYRF